MTRKEIDKNNYLKRKDKLKKQRDEQKKELSNECKSEAKSEKDLNSVVINLSNENQTLTEDCEKYK